jgi:serine/threonine protein kinase/tetratricopeptide (TPR) repeat protein
MNKPSWESIEAVFHEALELPIAERAAFVEEKSGGDASFRKEVLSLLESFSNESQFLENSPIADGITTFNPQMPDLTGEDIGSYKIIRKIGSGGMGDVYLAEDTRLAREVAIKFLKKDLLDDGSAKRRFIREAKAVAMIEHVNICGIHGIENVDDHDFIVMQYINGRTLSEFATAEKPSVETTLGLARQIAEALSIAHRRGIIHRDIKPGNILVTDEGVIKILDFGLAKIVQNQHLQKAEENQASQISQSGLILGTVNYMSPEQLRGDRLDFSSDVFSFGIVLREMLTGYHPFARRSQAETIAAILSGDIARSETRTEAIPPMIAKVLEKCLHQNRIERFHDGEELADALAANDLQKIPLLSRISGIYRYTALVFIVLLLTGTIAFYFVRESKPATLAILPIKNASSIPDAASLGFGLTGNLIGKFSRANKIRVVPHTRVAPLENRTPLEAASELGADMILAGTLVDRDGRVLLEMTLTRASDGREIASDQIEIDGEKLLDAQNRIAQRIIEKIAPTMSGVELATIMRPPTDNAEALRLYYKGRRDWNRLQGENVRNAIANFESAVALDPEFALAWAGLAHAYSLYSTPSSDNPVKPREAYAKARSYAERAIEIDPNLSEAWNALGMIELSYGWDWNKAEGSFQRAIALDPANAAARLGFSRYLTIRERVEDARAEGSKALELNPVDLSTRLNIAVVAAIGRDYARAEEQYKTIMTSGDTSPRVKYGLGLTLLRTNRVPEAIAIFEELYAIRPELPAAVLAYGYARTNREAEARKILVQLDSNRSGKFISKQEDAIVYFGLRDADNGFSNLMSACEERFPALPALLLDAILDDFRQDPRFEDVRRCVNQNSLQ